MNPRIQLVSKAPQTQPLAVASEPVRPVAHDRFCARCEACGHSWRLQQHDRILCPFCLNEPSNVIFRGSFCVLADEASGRWMR